MIDEMQNDMTRSQSKDFATPVRRGTRGRGDEETGKTRGGRDSERGDNRITRQQVKKRTEINRKIIVWLEIVSWWR